MERKGVPNVNCSELEIAKIAYCTFLRLCNLNLSYVACHTKVQLEDCFVKMDPGQNVSLT